MSVSVCVPVCLCMRLNIAADKWRKIRFFGFFDLSTERMFEGENAANTASETAGFMPEGCVGDWLCKYQWRGCMVRVANPLLGSARGHENFARSARNTVWVSRVKTFCVLCLML